MKKIMLFFIFLAATSFADSFMLENQTSYPMKNQKSKMMIQWASSSREVDAGNEAMMCGSELDQRKMQTIAHTGRVSLNIPKQSEYFRILVWVKDSKNPDLLTNWVEVVPNKTYTLKQDQLIPAVLMAGTGC